MKEKKILDFNVLGFFVCQDAGEEQNRRSVIPEKTGKKALSFLQYFVVNHGRNISSEELIDQFWPEKSSSDPANSLKNMLFKTRSLLKTVYPEQENLILTLPGCYTWNPSVRIRLDSEEFEQVCLEARKKPDGARLDTLLPAVALYKGDFLSGNDSEWAVSLRRYYQTLYLDICRMILPLLQEQERWPEMVGICEQASGVDFSADVFVTYQMQALISMGHPERALKIYRDFRERIWREFEIEPAERVEQVRMLADSMCQNNMDDRDILKMVAEKETDQSAFLCTFRVFQSVVALEKRHLARSGHSSALVIISLGNKVTPTTDARRLERILLEGLRTGDPVARLDAGSYILMLTGASIENAQIVMERIDRAFHKAYSHSSACLSYQVSLLRPDIASVS